MSTPSNSTKPSTTAADNVAKEQHDVPKSGTGEQDTVVDDRLKGSLNANVTNEDHPTVTADGTSPTTNVDPSADLAPRVPDVLVLPQGPDDGEIWIPKGGHDNPNGTPAKPAGPTRPSKPKRDN